MLIDVHAPLPGTIAAGEGGEVIVLENWLVAAPAAEVGCSAGAAEAVA